MPTTRSRAGTKSQGAPEAVAEPGAPPPTTKGSMPPPPLPTASAGPATANKRKRTDRVSLDNGGVLPPPTSPVKKTKKRKTQPASEVVDASTDVGTAPGASIRPDIDSAVAPVVATVKAAKGASKNKGKARAVPVGPPVGPSPQSSDVPATPSVHNVTAVVTARTTRSSRRNAAGDEGEGAGQSALYETPLPTPKPSRARTARSKLVPAHVTVSHEEQVAAGVPLPTTTAGPPQEEEQAAVNITDQETNIPEAPVTAKKASKSRSNSKKGKSKAPGGRQSTAPQPAAPTPTFVTVDKIPQEVSFPKSNLPLGTIPKRAPWAGKAGPIDPPRRFGLDAKALYPPNDAQTDLNGGQDEEVEEEHDAGREADVLSDTEGADAEAHDEESDADAEGEDDTEYTAGVNTNNNPGDVPAPVPGDTEANVESAVDTSSSTAISSHKLEALARAMSRFTPQNDFRLPSRSLPPSPVERKGQPDLSAHRWIQHPGSAMSSIESNDFRLFEKPKEPERQAKVAADVSLEDTDAAERGGDDERELRKDLDVPEDVDADLDGDQGSDTEVERPYRALEQEEEESEQESDVAPEDRDNEAGGMLASSMFATQFPPTEDDDINDGHQEDVYEDDDTGSEDSQEHEALEFPISLQSESSFVRGNSPINEISNEEDGNHEQLGPDSDDDDSDMEEVIIPQYVKPAENVEINAAQASYRANDESDEDEEQDGSHMPMTQIRREASPEQDDMDEDRLSPFSSPLSSPPAQTPSEIPGEQAMSESSRASTPSDVDGDHDGYERYDSMERGETTEVEDHFVSDKPTEPDDGISDDEQANNRVHVDYGLAPTPPFRTSRLDDTASPQFDRDQGASQFSQLFTASRRVSGSEHSAVLDVLQRIFNVESEKLDVEKKKLELKKRKLALMREDLDWRKSQGRI